MLADAMANPPQHEHYNKEVYHFYLCGVQKANDWAGTAMGMQGEAYA